MHEIGPSTLGLFCTAGWVAGPLVQVDVHIEFEPTTRRFAPRALTWVKAWGSGWHYMGIADRRLPTIPPSAAVSGLRTKVAPRASGFLPRRIFLRQALYGLAQTFKVQRSPALLRFSLHLESTAEGSTRVLQLPGALAPQTFLGRIFHWAPAPRHMPLVDGKQFAGHRVGSCACLPFQSGMAVATTRSHAIFSRNTISPRASRPMNSWRGRCQC